MGLDRCGSIRRVVAREAVSASDTFYPSGAAQAGSIPVPPEHRGGIVHVHAQVYGAFATGVTALVTVFGYVAGLGLWFALGQLNAGQTIGVANSASSKSPRAFSTPAVGDPDDQGVHHTEAFFHLGVYDRLYPMLTSLNPSGGGNVADMDVSFLFEGP